MLTLFLAGVVNAQREDNYMKFISRWKQPVLVIEPQKMGRIDGETKAGTRIEFFDSYAEVTDEEIAKLIMKTPSFGVDYWILKEEKIDLSTPQGAPSLEKMPSEKQADEQMEKKNEEIEGLKKSINQLTAIVQGLVEQKPKGKPGRKSKEKITVEEQSQEE